MILNYDEMPVKVVPNFKGGEGEAHIAAYTDAMGKILQCTLPTGSSIGMHTHQGDCEIVYVVSGTGVCVDDGDEYALKPGMRLYCPEGHTHGIRNNGTEPLVLFGILPLSK